MHIEILKSIIYFVATDCGQLVSPVNGMVKTTGTKFWDTATYSCMPGFQLQGQESRTCSDSGSWTGEAPTCVGE